MVYKYYFDNERSPGIYLGKESDLDYNNVDKVKNFAVAIRNQRKYNKTAKYYDNW